MQATTERRQQMLDYISDKRQTTVNELAEQFHISSRTVRRDLLILTETAPIYTEQGNGGGVRATDGWYSSRRYMTPQQEELLRRLSKDLGEEDRATMQSILVAFAKPRR